jgi:AbrB family looped-hinge helix DNA binding protein
MSPTPTSSLGPDPTITLAGTTHCVGPNGQVVIPKDLGDELGIEPGDETSSWRNRHHIEVRPAKQRSPSRRPQGVHHVGGNGQAAAGSVSSVPSGR